MNVRVDVTDDDILHGESCSMCGCPVALAMNRALRELGFDVHVSVTIDAIGVWPGKTPSSHGVLALKVGAIDCVDTPEEVASFVEEYDDFLAAVDRLNLDPFSFRIELPDSLPRLEPTA